MQTVVNPDFSTQKFIYKTLNRKYVKFDGMTSVVCITALTKLKNLANVTQMNSPVMLPMIRQYRSNLIRHTKAGSLTQMFIDSRL